jgi:hypothetical protein
VALVALDNFVHRHFKTILAVIIGYLILWHYYVLGYTSWDGFIYRIPPIVERVQEGDLGRWKLDGPIIPLLYPFFEWIHAPFLWAFGLPGLFFSFPLVLLPLSILAVYCFIRELTDDSQWAMYGALTFLSIPFVNEQPFAGYIDFAVIGTLAFFLYAILRVACSPEVCRKDWVIFGVATLLFSMSRMHAPYIAGILFVALFVFIFSGWNRGDARQSDHGRIFVLISVFLVGMLPSIVIQVDRTLLHGTPIYPYQFRVFGFGTEAGMSLEDVLIDGGLESDTWRGKLYSFCRGWLWSGEMPRAFFDSRYLGAGLSLWLVLLSIPLVMMRLKRFIVFILGLLIAVSMLTQDFWLPRFAFSLTLVVSVLLGAALRFSLMSNRPWIYGILLTAIMVQLIGRPLYIAAGISRWDLYYSRINFSGSPFFIDGPALVTEVYPDLDADFIVIHPVDNNFTVPLYGQKLSNRIVWTLNSGEPVSHKVIRDIFEVARNSSRPVFIVDHAARTHEKMNFKCVIPRPWICLAYDVFD